MFKSPKDRCDVIDKIIFARLKSMDDAEKNAFIREKLQLIYITSDDEYIVDDACEYLKEPITKYLTDSTD